MNIKALIILFFIVNSLFAKAQDPASYVDPFIGTGKSAVLTKWGSEGGTYPGAVAPSGFIQLTPETRNSGYDFSDTTISFFSCVGHYSGFPNGSAGRFLVMPVDTRFIFSENSIKRRFFHKDEKATPGYYSVLFKDNNTLVEATVTERAGMFRFTFPAKVIPQLFISDSGTFNAATHYNESYVSKQRVENGYLLTFAPATYGAKVILLSLSASTVDKESAERNIAVELNDAFDQIREYTLEKWTKALSVVEITDSSKTNKTIFYTALYHALLMPWIISDVDGHYRGADREVHTVSGREEYGGFSPWDTFRSLHPLLSLLYRERQSEMVLSILDVFKQTGHLPIESMTGNHSIPIIVDSYLKGVPGIDSTLAYAAMKKSIADTPYLQSDMEIYHQQGYIPFSYPESVTRTVEYAYDDWALAQFAGLVMHKKDDYDLFMNRSYNYRNLFHPDDMFMLPRQGQEFKLEPGNSGYKEGDKWVYSYFVPQHQQDLVNLMGGKNAFTNRLYAAFTDRQIIFDNETVFHVPYLFNAANEPHKTQKWVDNIMRTRFNASPGGLPGNDDLGSTSSWYVLSAMGIYPACPGSPEYSIGVPLFQSLRINLPNGKHFEIRRKGKGHYIKSLMVNNAPFNRLLLPHAIIMKGGDMLFDMGAPSNWPETNTNNDKLPDFNILDCSVSKAGVEPDEPFWVKFTLRNNGSIGTMQMKLSANGQIIAGKNCLVNEHSSITDSILCRLYKIGDANISVNGLKDVTISVIHPDHPFSKEPDIINLAFQSLIKSGETQKISFTVKNTGGIVQTYNIPVIVNGKINRVVRLTLEPGEQTGVFISFIVNQAGWQTVNVNNIYKGFKVYNAAAESLLLDLSLSKSLMLDSSGFANNGKVIGAATIVGDQLQFGKNCFVEVPNSSSLDVMGNTLTMMAWVFPQSDEKETGGLVDMFTKGDSHVLQTENSKTLTFFAGGWGRGDCTVALPENWKDHWHHIAGVCYGDSLKLYIDGQLKGATKLENNVNLSGINKWTFGRNEEFPSARIFNGLIDNMKVFAAPLSEDEVKVMMMKNVHKDQVKSVKIPGARIM
ncbi:alpha-1,2-mannosidase, putative [Chitinophaga sp. CF118]|uniref:GH92 family glycosyl hydrolase n=1 Tax=Chitinophaga sp. CF118 TaxID=1884367 RepID=UPI0008E4EA2E|nr:GH92 family glycosyl hydrolase [Chitinophaga sp. CF118]SFE92516.1 alpha-1,2-mannosidase, putative [Chitinophaga sp. CF118]